MDKTEEIEEKTERLVRMLADKRLGGVLIGSQYNFSWLTCGGTNGIDESREVGAGALLVRSDGRRFVLANSIEMPRLLAEELDGQNYDPVEFGWEEERSSLSFLPDRARSLLNGGALGTDLSADGGLEPLEAEIARVRYRLTASEIERYRALGRDAARAIEEMVRGLQPGVTEHEIARRAADALRAYGCRAVVNLVAADERIALFRHPVPINRKWEKVVMVAVCARRKGLIASLTRIAYAGEVPHELKRRTLATARANAHLFAATKPGTHGSELYTVVARAYAEEGFPGEERLHHQGGAIGYRTRDWIAHPLSDERVQLHQAFGWNPSITGTKVEETCIAFEDRVQVVTTTQEWPKVSVTAGGREYLLPDVLAL